MAAIIAFGGCLWGSFHFDDYSLFSTSLWRPFDIRPLTYVTFWFNDWLGGRNPAGYHAVNLLLHLAAILLLWEALGTLLPAQARLIATAIFAVHPFQADPVNYIFARSTLLATVLCLAALLSWTRGRRWWAVVWFAAALLAKEECVAFPAFLLLLSLATSRASKEWKPIVVMFVLAMAAGLRVMFEARSIAGSGAGAQAGISPQSYLIAQGVVILRYLRMLLLPWGFTVDPDIQIPPVWLGALAWLAVLSLAGVALLHFKAARPGFWFLAGFVLLLPSSSIFPANDLAADRRLYLPMIGFAACAGLLLQRVQPKYLAAGLLLLASLSFERTAVWRTEESLWTDAVDKAPGKLRPKIQLARAVPPDRAMAILEDARRLAPDDPRIATEKGRVYLTMGKPGEALVEFGRALALAPHDANAFNNRGAALLALDQKDAAREDFERALAIDPCEFNALLNLRHLGIAKPLPAQCHFSAEQDAAFSGK
ncbi:MAG TPA: tetratricopeptide repeat protein [Bryobacteraceae bacterium]|nr:tetratricopeptide repeat protein [Bryobacteraceae bacterium]